MYQSVDDINGSTDPADAPQSLWPLAGLGLLFSGAAFVLVYINMPGALNLRKSPMNDPLINTQARAAYLRSIAEPDVALRRARLTDFITQYQQHPLAKPTRAQLDVLDEVEAIDWQNVLTIALDPEISTEASITALRDFEDLWGGYLGGRDREITQLEQRLQQRARSPGQPDRSLPASGSNFPNSVPGDQLVGAETQPPVRIIRPETASPLRRTPATGTNPIGSVRTRPLSNRPANDGRDRTRPLNDRPDQTTPRQVSETPFGPFLDDQTGPVITPPRVQRSVKPRYPRTALRRRVSAVVTLSLNIDRRGRVQMTDLVSVEADRYENDFVRAAKRAARRMRFDPRMVDNRAAPAIDYVQTFRFEPDE